MAARLFLYCLYISAFIAMGVHANHLLNITTLGVFYFAFISAYADISPVAVHMGAIEDH
jgi:hypothetical protein